MKFVIYCQGIKGSMGPVLPEECGFVIFTHTVGYLTHALLAASQFTDIREALFQQELYRQAYENVNILIVGVN